MRSRAGLAPFALALAALALGLLAYAVALDPARQLAGRDLFHLFYPLGKLVAGATREGHLLPPPRDPTRGLGVALAADPLAWGFYPPRLLHALVDYDLGFKLLLLLHGSLAGLGTARLARALGASRRASVLAVAATVLSGPVLSLHRHPNLLAGVAWAPFALALVIETAWAETPGPADRRRVALAGLCVGLTLLAGGMEVVLGLAPAVVFAAVVCARNVRARTLDQDALVRSRAVSLAVVALGLGVLVAGVQLAPMWAWVPTTVRPDKVAASEAFVWSLPLARAHALALPLDPGEGPRVPGGEPFSPSIYLGLVTGFLAVFGAASGDRRARVVGLSALLLVVLALGAEGRLLVLVRHLPVYDRFRYPEKLLILVATLVPAVAARGLETVLRRHGPRVALALLALATLDVALVNARPSRRLLPTVPTAWLHEPPAAVALVGSGRVLAGPRTQVAPAPPPGSRETDEERFQRTKARHREVLLGGLAGLYGLEDASVYGPFVPRALWDLLESTAADQYFLGVADVTGFIVRTEPGESPTRLALRHPDPGAPQDLPLEPIPGTDLAVAHAPGGPRAAFVPFAVTEVRSPRRLAGTPARILERDAWHVLVEVAAPERGLCVLSELYLDGARATVDGATTEVRFTDSALIAIPVDAGTRRVLVSFGTPGLLEGGLATLAGLVVVAFLLVGRGPRLAHPS